MNPKLVSFLSRNFQHEAMSRLQDIARYSPEHIAMEIARWAEDYTIEYNAQSTISTVYLARYRDEVPKIKEYEKRKVLSQMGTEMAKVVQTRTEEDERMGESTFYRVLILKPSKS